jgi:hypothetical protein
VNYFITPITSQTEVIGGTSTTFNGPKYLQTDMSGLAFTCVNFGLDGWGIVTLAAASAALSAEVDVYSFPANLATVMAAGDVSTLAAFLATANIPSDQITAGMTFSQAIQIIAKIFMVNQALCGATGAPTFSTGVTLATTIADSDLAPLAPAPVSQGLAQAGVGAPSGGSGGSNNPTIPSAIGPFNFAGVQGTQTIGAMLDSISQQFVGSVELGSFL